MYHGRRFPANGAQAAGEGFGEGDDTGVGDPSASTAAKGEKFFGAVTERIGGFLAELAAADPKELYART